MWRLFAILSALFAAATSILAKMGMKGVDSNLATAIRTVIILVMSWGIVLFNGKVKTLPQLTATNWVFIILSAVATGFSWLFYFRAVQMGDVSSVAPIDKASVVLTMVMSFLILQEKITLQKIIGGLLVGLGTVILALPL